MFTCSALRVAWTPPPMPAPAAAPMAAPLPPPAMAPITAPIPAPVPTVFAVLAPRELPAWWYWSVRMVYLRPFTDRFVSSSASAGFPAKWPASFTSTKRPVTSAPSGITTMSFTVTGESSVPWNMSPWWFFSELIESIMRTDRTVPGSIVTGVGAGGGVGILATGVGAVVMDGAGAL